jgi:hypothetical protein
MSWFSRLRNWQTDQANGIGIRADYHDSEDDNFASGINLAINVAGGNVPTANLPMGGFKHTGAADGSARTDYATLGQVQVAASSYAVDSVGADAYAITLAPAIAAYTTGQVFRFYPATANTGAATLAVNGLAAKSIKKHKDVDLSDNDIKIGQIVEVVYDGTNMQMLSPLYGVVTQNGAATFGADAGASDSYAVTLSPAPAVYVTGMSIYVKINTANTGAATINCNSLGAKTIKKRYNSDLATGDLIANQIINLVYDGTNFQLTSVYGSVGDNINSTITQAAHGFVAGDILRFNGTIYVKAQADSAANAQAIGIVSAVVDVDNFTITLSGKVTGLVGLTAGVVYFLSPLTAGLLTSTEPTGASQISKLLFIADSTTSGYFINSRGRPILSAASQSDQETGTSTIVYVSPAVQQSHPSSPKGWVFANASGGIQSSYNVTSVTDVGTGEINVNWDVDFSSTNYAVGVTVKTDNAYFGRVADAAFAAGLTKGYCTSLAPALADPSSWSFFAFGDQ